MFCPCSNAVSRCRTSYWYQGEYQSLLVGMSPLVSSSSMAVISAWLMLSLWQCSSTVVVLCTQWTVTATWPDKGYFPFHLAPSLATALAHSALATGDGAARGDPRCHLCREGEGEEEFCDISAGGVLWLRLPPSMPPSRHKEPLVR